jgi:hypothetical protein
MTKSVKPLRLESWLPKRGGLLARRAEGAIGHRCSGIGYNGGVGFGSISTGRVLELDVDAIEVFHVAVSHSGIVAYAGANPPLRLWSSDSESLVAELGASS